MVELLHGWAHGRPSCSTRSGGAKLGKQGGEALRDRYGPEYYSAIGKQGGAARHGR